jgi:hypothetical protein
MRVLGDKGQSGSNDALETSSLVRRQLAGRLRRQMSLRPQWGMWLSAICLFSAGVLIERIVDDGRSHLAAYLSATFFGILVGSTEIVARYRDKPTAALQTGPGFIYVMVNAAASLAVFWLVHTKQIDLKLSANIGTTLNEVLLAGFGSMAFFRTSIFTVRIRDTDVAVGPAAVLQVILNAADRACDRLRAGPRAQGVKDIMVGVSFTRAKLALPLHCLALMQNVSAEEQNQLNQAIASVDTAAMSDEVKAYNLGLLLMTLVGEDVLKEAISALGPMIQGPPADDPAILAQASQLAFADMPILIEICIALYPMPQDEAIEQRRKSWLEFGTELTPDAQKNVIILARLRRYFGPDTVFRALALLSDSKKTVKRVTEPLNVQDLTPQPGEAGVQPPTAGK